MKRWTAVIWGSAVVTALAVTSCGSKKDGKKGKDEAEESDSSQSERDGGSDSGSAKAIKKPLVRENTPGSLSLELPEALTNLSDKKSDGAATLRLLQDGAESGEGNSNGMNEIGQTIKEILSAFTNASFYLNLADEKFPEILAKCAADHGANWTKCEVAANTHAIKYTEEMFNADKFQADGSDAEAAVEEAEELQEASLKLQEESEHEVVAAEGEIVVEEPVVDEDVVEFLPDVGQEVSLPKMEIERFSSGAYAMSVKFFVSDEENVLIKWSSDKKKVHVISNMEFGEGADKFELSMSASYDDEKKMFSSRSKSIYGTEKYESEFSAQEQGGEKNAVKFTLKYSGDGSSGSWGFKQEGFTDDEGGYFENEFYYDIVTVSAATASQEIPANTEGIVVPASTESSEVGFDSAIGYFSTGDAATTDLASGLYYYGPATASDLKIFSYVMIPDSSDFTFTNLGATLDVTSSKTQEKYTYKVAWKADGETSYVQACEGSGSDVTGCEVEKGNADEIPSEYVTESEKEFEAAGFTVNKSAAELGGMTVVVTESGTNCSSIDYGAYEWASAALVWGTYEGDSSDLSSGKYSFSVYSADLDAVRAGVMCKTVYTEEAGSFAFETVSATFTVSAD